MKKKILVLGICMLAVIGLAACGKKEKESSNTIRLFVSGDASEGSAYTKMAAKYKEETGIDVEVTDVPYADMMTKISKAVQADDAPDVVRASGIEPDWTDYLQDLTEIGKNAKVIDSLAIKDSKDVVKALPVDVTAVGMFINTDLFDKAGVKYPTSEEDIWTWDEFLTAVKTVKEKTDAKYGFVMDASDHRLRAFTYQFGGQDFVFDKAADSYKTDEDTKKALQLFVDLNNEGVMPKSVWTSGEDASSMFKSGLIPAYISGSWQVMDFTKNIADFKWQAIYMPYEKTRATNMGGNFVLSFKNSKNAEAGKKFIEWLYEEKNYQQLASYAGYLPAVEGLEINYTEGKEAFDIFNKEVAAAAQPISSYQTNNQVMATLNGNQGLTGEYRESMIKVLNDEITLDAAIEATIKDYNKGFLDK